MKDFLTAALAEIQRWPTQPSGHFLVAIAGAPGAGKSTLAEQLAERLPRAKVLPMDGFHYDNAVLEELGLRSRKGAPETFDFAGFKSTIERIAAQDSTVAIPIFDREADLARAGACLIDSEVQYVISEGNYLLLDEYPWRELLYTFHLTIFLDVPRDELERRLLQRWLDLGDPEDKARHWVASNDMPNVDRVISRRLRADLTLSWAK